MMRQQAEQVASAADSIPQVMAANESDDSMRGELLYRLVPIHP